MKLAQVITSPPFFVMALNNQVPSVRRTVPARPSEACTLAGLLGIP